MTDDPINRIEAALEDHVLYLFTDSGNHAFSADDLRTMLDRLKAAEAENERLKSNAMQWRKPGPVTAEHPLDCLIVVPALRQADGDWWIGSSEFLTEDAPIAWCADTSIARAALAQLVADPRDPPDRGGGAGGTGRAA